MSSARYKTLTSYLPGMASIVNSFHSPDVQMNVFRLLVDALDDKKEGDVLSQRRAPPPAERRNGDEVLHELVEGGSIHMESALD